MSYLGRAWWRYAFRGGRLPFQELCDGPLGVLPNHPVSVVAKTLQLRQKPQIAGVPHRHANVPEPAAIFYPFHRRAPEDSAEILLIKSRQRFERRVKERLDYWRQVFERDKRDDA